MHESASLSGEEKTFVAMAAAMGGGCRACADRLFAVAQSLDMDLEDIERAFVQGLGVRDAATRLMREKARSLQRRERKPGDAGPPAGAERIRGLARLAAAVASNAAPLALGYAEAAREAGASEAAIGVAIGIGRTVRGKAQGFSDGELADVGAGEEGAATFSDAEGRAGAQAPGKECGCDEPPRRAPASCCG